mmetsp:Transcript_13254/g.32356  ORF Transcript_13254/g.32356 Transcript_13254/m.32356 type:complete len:117 (+) Transcript_13254:789-1139(+)
MAVRLGETLQVDDAWNGRGDQPWESQHTIDQVEAARKQKIVVVRLSVLELVRLVVDKMPCDSIVQVAEQEGEDSRTGGGEDCPAFSIEVGEVNKPRTGAVSCLLVGAFKGPGCGTA